MECSKLSADINQTLQNIGRKFEESKSDESLFLENYDEDCSTCDIFSVLPLERKFLEYLEKNHLHKYVTDFPTKNLLKRINISKDVMIFPHLGASTKESEINCAVMACSQLSDFLKSGKIVNSVNFPNINSEKFGTHRLFIANNNEPGIISKIAECLATNKINISEFVNKSRGDLACNIIDTDDEIPIDIVLKLEKISGVSKARLCY